jgi:hypothetical protein
MDKQHAVQLLFRWLPGLGLQHCQESGSPGSRSGSEDEPHLGSCTAAGCDARSDGSSCGASSRAAACCGASGASLPSSSSGSGSEEGVAPTG